MTTTDFNSNLLAEIESIDKITQGNTTSIINMIEAITRRTTDKAIIDMVNSISSYAQDSMNEVNALAEKLGVNHTSSIDESLLFRGELQ